VRVLDSCLEQIFHGARVDSSGYRNVDGNGLLPSKECVSQGGNFDSKV